MLWNGERLLVHLTVAAADGGGVDETSDFYKNLTAGIDAARHPDQPVRVDSYQLLQFNLEAKVGVDRDYIVEDVLAAVSEALQEAFAFEQRTFGQAVTVSEVLAVMQRVKGVIAVDLDKLDGVDPHQQPRLPAHIARWDQNNMSIKPAELLIVHPDEIQLTEMTL